MCTWQYRAGQYRAGQYRAGQYRAVQGSKGEQVGYNANMFPQLGAGEEEGILLIYLRLKNT